MYSFYLLFQQVTKCFFEGGYRDTNVYFLDNLAAEHVLEGPAIIIDQHRYGKHDCNFKLRSASIVVSCESKCLYQKLLIFQSDLRYLLHLTVG